MNQDKQNVAELAKAEMIRLWEQVDNLNKRIDYQRRLLDTHCQHVSETVLSKYHEGGYDYVSSIQITHTCDLCGKILEAYNDPHHKGNHA
jgi:hypothetical protein